MLVVRLSNLEPVLVWVMCVVGIGACCPAHATTEAEAVDELIAELGAILPCQRYAVAWLALPPSGIEHRCAGSLEEATLLRQGMPGDRVYYTIDMETALDRYASVYRLRGTPPPAVVLAQFVENVATLAGSEEKLGSNFSPLMVYSKTNAPMIPPASMVIPQVLPTRYVMVFP
jgi:hypothetical protein